MNETTIESASRKPLLSTEQDTMLRRLEERLEMLEQAVLLIVKAAAPLGELRDVIRETEEG